MSDGRGPSPRPLRFGVSVRAADDARSWEAKARRIEALGYDLLAMPDHLTHQFAVMPALTAAAAATTRLRVGSSVIANDYRNPVLLAKEAATVDVLSGGRLELGLGTGWYVSDYAALGLSLDPPAVRVGRLEEAVRLMKRLWSEETVDHDGAWYHVRGARVLPRPVQQPHPRIVIGATRPRMLRLAAEEADVVSIIPPLFGPGAGDAALKSPAAYLDQLAIVRAAAGSRFSTLDINAMVEIRLTDEPDESYAAAAAGLGLSVDAIRGSPFHVFGRLEWVVQRLREIRDEHGINYHYVAEGEMETFAPLVAALREA